MKQRYKKKFHKGLSIFGFCLFAVFLLVLQSCIDREDFDFNKIAGFKWNPDLAVPLVDTKIGIDNFISNFESDYLVTDEDGLISFVYNDNLFSYELGDLVEIPSSSLQGEIDLDMNLSLPDLSNELKVTLDQLLDGMQGSGLTFPSVTLPGTKEFDLPPFENVVLMECSQGTMDIEILNGFSADLAFELTLINKESQSVIGNTLNYNVPSQGSEKKSLHLAGQVIEGEVLIALANISSPGSTQPWNGSDELGFQITSSDVEVTRATIILTEDVDIDEIEEVITLDLDEMIESVMLTSGDLKVSFEGPQLGEIEVFLPEFTRNGSPLSFPINLSSARSDNKELNAYSIDLTKFDPGYNSFSFRIKGKIPQGPVTFTRNEKVQYSAIIENLKFESITGYFNGDYVLDIPEARNAFEGFNDLNGISLKNAILELKVVNSSGIGIGLDFDEVKVSKNNGTETKGVNIEGSNKVIISGQEQINSSPAESYISINNISDLLEFGPDEFVYKISASVNPEGAENLNFLTNESKLEVSVNLDVPFYVHFDNISFKDTVEIDFSSENIDISIEKALLKTYITNEFPLDAYVQLYYTDGDYNILGQVFSNDRVKIIASGEVDADGHVQKSSVLDQIIELNSDALQEFVEAKHLIIDASMNTGGESHVRFNTKHSIDVKVGLQTKFKLN